MPAFGQKNATFPAFIRLPIPPAKCLVSGLCRSTLNDLILGPHPQVRSKVLRQRGSKRGIRLIDTASLLEYLHGLPDGVGESNGEGGNYE